MPVAASSAPAGHDVAATLHQAVQAAEALLADAQRAVAQRVMNDGRAIARAFDREQRATHGLAWLATYVEALRQLAAYAERLAATATSARSSNSWCTSAPAISGADSRRHSHESEQVVRLADLGSPSAVASRVTGG
jgi:(2S)-methylsuccinyl-CoA dehydrogenase